MGSRGQWAGCGVFAGCALLLCGVSVVVLLASHGEPHVVATFHPDDATEIRILSECAWKEIFEPRLSVEYEVWRGEACVVPMTIIGYKRPKASMSFKLVRAGSIVAIAEEANPNVVLVLHDCVSGESWPFRGGNEEYASVEEMRKETLQPLWGSPTPVTLRARQ